MVRATIVGDNTRSWNYRFSGIGFGIVLLLIGVIFLLKDLGYIATKISFWTYFFLIIGGWWVIGRIFR